MANAKLIRHAVALLAGAILYSLSNPAGSADVRFADTDSGTYIERDIAVEGEIEKGDWAKVKEAFDPTRLVKRLIVLSPGGDVDEAIKIAEFANEKLVEVAGPIVHDNCKQPPNAIDWVKLWYPQSPENCACYSACAIIWLAAPVRSFGYGVGVHRARFDSSYFAGLSAAEAEKKYNYLLNQLIAFLTSHDVPKPVIDKMNATSSNDIYMLSSEPIHELVESDESFVIHWWAHDSHGSA